MACFLVPAAEAVVTTVVARAMKSRAGAAPVGSDSSEGQCAKEVAAKSPFLRKLHWLTSMLWGGSFLLGFEHIWSGEVTPWFPFLTAAGNPNDLSAMLHEMATSGVAMAALVTVVWVGMVLVTNAIEKRPLPAKSAVN